MKTYAFIEVNGEILELREGNYGPFQLWLDREFSQADVSRIWFQEPLKFRFTFGDVKQCWEEKWDE